MNTFSDEEIKGRRRGLFRKSKLISKEKKTIIPEQPKGLNPDRYYTQYTLTYLENNFKRLGYDYKGREKQFMFEMINKTGLPINLQFLNDNGGITGETTIHAKSGNATIQLSNWYPSVSGIEMFLHELAHAIDGILYWRENSGDLSRMKEHGQSWKMRAVELGAVPERSLMIWDRNNEGYL